MQDTFNFISAGQKTKVHAILVGERIDTSTFVQEDVLSTLPFAYRVGDKGLVVLFRYGVVVMAGLSHDEEQACLQRLQPRIRGPLSNHEDETAVVEVLADKEDQIPPGGPISIKSASLERLLLIADVLAKSVVLAHDEREVATAFDIAPFSRELAKTGRTPGGRRAILKRIGNALLVQQHVTGYVAVMEKPDVLWDRPDLDRLYARLEDEYELKERVDILNRKLSVVAENAKVLTDIIDTRRSLRLEATIVLLIVFEVLITIYQMVWGRGGH